MALLRRSAPAAAKALAAAAMVAVVMGSAVWTKRAGTLPALVGFEKTSIAPNTPAIHPVSGRIMTGDTTNIATNSNPNSITSGTLNGTSAEAAPGFGVAAIEPVTETSPEYSLSTRWFDGRPVRPARVMVMRITGYSPDERSCGEFADGQTATLHSVWTNAMQLVAADPTVLPYGTMVSVPGYAGEEIVPVLDCGGAIKGARLDLLFPTHEIALEWGVKDLRVVIWEYADGRPAPNPRKVR
jgi:3D (Asp-Asp-Asp) domain-containing protein